jgi:NADP-dependent 3-hydroxy acid dehydrogenase YdfG
MNKNNLAIVIGGTGAIGNAIASEIENLGFRDVIRIGTKTTPSIDFNDEDTILNTVNFVKEKQKPISILFDATGIKPSELDIETKQKLRNMLRVPISTPSLPKRFK